MKLLRNMRMTRMISMILPLALAVILAGCGSTSHNASTSTDVSLAPKISGAWEFKLQSSSGAISAMEVALQEGQTLVDGVYQPDGNISASGTQMSFVTFAPGTGFADGFGGYCSGAASANTLSGAVTALGNPISNFTFTENGNIFDVTATLSSDGQSMLGTYQSAASSNCPDGGVFTGAVVAKLSGNYAGNITLPSCSVAGCDSATATLSESSSGTATLTLTLQGTDNGLLTLTGPVTGNAFSVQGTLQGQTVVLYGYYELTHNPTDSQNDLPTLYLVNPSAPSEPVGLLTLSQT
jgi:hypothetical protein